MRHLLAVILAGLAGAIAWLAGIAIFFGPAQGVLANPGYQSAKFLQAFAQIEPLPRMAARPWILPLGLVLIGIVYACVYSRIRGALGNGVLARGLRFGLVAWALMAFWFEFYLPWNVMHEPFLLALLELALWLLVLSLVGVAIAFVYERIVRRLPA
jgi:hypothetical protein